MDQQTIDRIHQSFNAQSMMTTLGANLIEVTSGQVRIAAPILPGAKQQQGLAHAGLTFAIGDSSAGYAALTLMPPKMEVVPAEIKINLIAPATGDRLVATGRVVKPGKRLCVVTAEVHAETAGSSALVAILQGTMVPVPA